jgi:hypothetical protein
MLQALWNLIKLGFTALAFALKLIGGTAIAVACFYLWYDSRPSSEEVDRVSLEMYQKMPRPRYFFEPGGQVCFAQFYQERRRWYQFPTGGPVFTRVPCTRAVLDSLENKSSVPDEFIAEDARAPSTPFTLPASP